MESINLSKKYRNQIIINKEILKKINRNFKLKIEILLIYLKLFFLLKISQILKKNIIKLLKV